MVYGSIMALKNSSWGLQLHGTSLPEVVLSLEELQVDDAVSSFVIPDYRRGGFGFDIGIFDQV